MPDENFSTTYTSIRLPAPIVRTYQLVSKETGVPLIRLIEMAMKYYQPALRELREEIGTDKAEVLAENPRWLTYDLPEELIGKLWGGRYRGQTQKWFIMRFTGTDGDINIATEVPEFLDWKWADLERLPSLIVPFKRQLYEKLVEEFAPIARKLAAESEFR